MTGSAQLSVIHTNIFLERRMRLRVPIDLDFKDEEMKDLILSTWAKEKDIPPVYGRIRRQVSLMKELNSIFRINDMALVHNNEGTFLDFLLTNIRNVNKLYKQLKSIFPEGLEVEASNKRVSIEELV